MNKPYVVIAITFGDGEAHFGHRVWSERFENRVAAEQACQFIQRNCSGQAASATIIEDYIED